MQGSGSYTPVSPIELPPLRSTGASSGAGLPPDGTPTARISGAATRSSPRERAQHHQQPYATVRTPRSDSPIDDPPPSPPHRHKLPYQHTAADRAAYRHCASLCLLVGDLYPWLDFPAGVCFVIGSLLFIAGPAVGLADSSASVTAVVWPQLVGVIFFTLAKIFAEGKAVYAHFYKKPAKRSGLSYHVAIINLLCGGLLFLAAYVLQLQQDEEAKENERRLQWCNTVGSANFTVGSALLCFNARTQFFPRECDNKHNQYMLASIFLLFGSIGYLSASALAIPPADTVSEQTLQIINIVAGVMFLFGSTFLLTFSIFESGEMRAGPDPEALHLSRPPHEDDTNQPHKVRRRMKRFVRQIETS